MSKKETKPEETSAKAAENKPEPTKKPKADKKP
jgi:hypothetical protein